MSPVITDSVDVEVVRTYKYLGVHLYDRLERPFCLDTVYKQCLSLLPCTFVYSLDLLHPLTPFLVDT